jgi:hypothetical protein
MSEYQDDQHICRYEELSALSRGSLRGEGGINHAITLKIWQNHTSRLDIWIFHISRLSAWIDYRLLSGTSWCRLYIWKTLL